MIKKSFYCFLFIVVAFANAVVIEECKLCVSSNFSKELPKEVAFQDCKKPPCKLYGGKNVMVTFETPRDVKALSIYMMGYFFNCHQGDLHKYPAEKYIFNTDGTKATFPLMCGGEYVYKNHIPDPKRWMHPIIPSVFSLIDENQNPIFCYQLDIQI